jgi:hypothetical protein
VQERAGRRSSALVRHLRRLTTGFLRPIPRRSVEFFTFLDLGIDPGSPDTVVRHRFQQMRGRPVQTGIPAFEGAVFLGQPVVELGWASEAAYESIVVEFQAAVGAPVAYVPHPRENGAMVRRLIQRGILVLPAAKPFEIRVASRDVVPTALGGITTTALITANALAGSPPTFIYTLANLAPRHEKEIEAAIRDLTSQIPGAILKRATSSTA